MHTYNCNRHMREAVGSYIRRNRTTRPDLPQHKLGHMVGKSRYCICQYERGAALPSAEVLIRMFRIFNPKELKALIPDLDFDLLSEADSADPSNPNI